LNCISKELLLKFEDKYFIVNLAEGDLEDSWNSIQFSDKTTLDINFSWEYSEENPSVCLYGLTYLPESDTYETNTSEAYPIKITNIFGNKADYLNWVFQPNNKDNSHKVIHYRVYSGCKLIKKATSLDIVSDFIAKSVIVDKLNDVHTIGMDRFGAKTTIEIDQKYYKKYEIQLKSKERNQCVSKADNKDNRIKYNIK
jgi:hypothetical protein